MICPLCAGEGSLYDKDKLRSYYQCAACSLVFVPRSELIDPFKEKERYEAHENTDSDGYTSYLSKIADAIRTKLPSSSTGLDYGCGRTKILATLIGQNVKSYDLFFHPDDSLLNDTYDFIILSEVIEHLRVPRSELMKLKNMLNPKGMLFIKTKWLPQTGFENWFYKRDITHVQFFSKESFEEISRQFDLSEAEQIGEDLWLFRNNG